MYSTIKNTSKAILLSGLNVDDVLYRDAFCFVVRDGDNFNIICGEFVITIDNNDIVSITQSQFPSNVPQAYTVSSVDELPSNAVDGSMAIVPSDSIKGKWLFNEELNFGVLGYEDIICEGLFRIPEKGGVFDKFILYSDEDGWIYVSGSYETYLGSMGFTLYDNDGSGWSHREVEIFEVTSADERFEPILKANAKRLSGGYSLYTHENGQWVYKCEIV